MGMSMAITGMLTAWLWNKFMMTLPNAASVWNSTTPSTPCATKFSALLRAVAPSRLLFASTRSMFPAAFAAETMLAFDQFGEVNAFGQVGKADLVVIFLGRRRPPER